MDQNYEVNNDNNSEQIPITELFYKIKATMRTIGTKWASILLISLIGAALGLGYAFIKKPTYTAVCTFVLEDSKSASGLGQFGGLAALAGLNLGGGGGIFEGDNILELYKSRLMIEKALLSIGNFNGKKQLLINRYIESFKLRDKWADDDQLTGINFSGNADMFNRKQDSIITDLAEQFNIKLLNVTKPDKKLNIIRVEFVTKDELFSKYFTEKLVENVNDFYIKTKTKKTYQNLMILQHQADSVKAILNSSINGVASAIDAAPNANPQMTTLRVTSQKKQVDVQANTAIYSQIVQNLELAKISFRQETPLIQVIDKPILPLTVNKVTFTKGAVLGFLIATVMYILFLTIRHVFFTANSSLLDN